MISYRRLFYRGMTSRNRVTVKDSDGGAKPEGRESPGQFIVRISKYFDKWVEVAGGDETFKGMSEL